MTLICTVISNLGIIQASDSNLTGTGSTAPGTGQKVFRLGFSNGALSLSGAYGVGDQPMDSWMQACIRGYRADGNPTLEGFAHHLGSRLSCEMNESQKKAMNMLQVAGYVADVNGAHPEMLFVRNVDHIDEQTGDYVGSNDQFEVTEDFWNRDCLTEDARAAFRGGGAWRYFNGFPHGRMAFHGLSTLFRHFQEQAWAHPEWRFRPPRTLDQLASFLKLEIRAIATMFGCSDYDAPYVGGAVQVETVGPPVGGAML